jgi:hypothetical protein
MSTTIAREPVPDLMVNLARRVEGRWSCRGFLPVHVRKVSMHLIAPDSTASANVLPRSKMTRGVQH